MIDQEMTHPAIFSEICMRRNVRSGDEDAFVAANGEKIVKLDSGRPGDTNEFSLTVLKEFVDAVRKVRPGEMEPMRFPAAPEGDAHRLASDRLFHNAQVDAGQL